MASKESKKRKLFEYIGEHHVRCIICGTGEMHINGASRHFNCREHRENERNAVWLDIKERNLNYMEFTGAVHVRCKICKTGLMHINGAHGHFDSSPHNTRIEQITLLEMMIWKASICDGVFFRTIQEVRDYSFLDQNFDPFEYMRKKRLVDGATVIIPLVMKFLY